MAKWQEKLNGDSISWLLESNPWTKYRTLLDLLDAPSSSNEVLDAKDELNNDPSIKTLITKDS